MTKIKITSNPYDKRIQYARWIEESQTWLSIDYQNNPESRLISEELVGGFFPFQANKILSVMIDEFSDGSLDLLFEGTEDEFNVLKAICENEKYSSIITVQRDNRFLENARDILPDIVEIFKEINPLITQSVRDKSLIENELGKFSEATNDVIPVCIVGNYSAGKSSFINALIGHEILPSGDEPVTARVYKISPSHYEDRGRIKFSYDGYDVQVKFRGNNQGVESQLESHPLIEKIKEVIKPLDTVDLVGSINKTLKTINHFEEEVFDNNVSDLIEIEVPFNSSMIGRGKTDFVIFDTPGSNSASNSKHIRVLKQAMENMSNGLPIFVSEFNSLDSMDNENLYKEIASLEELDNRFTMIVVNKSDKANLPKEGFTHQDEDRILSMSIPKNLYSCGIFFVSSVIALGAKTKGEFEDEFYEEIYEDTVSRFSDPEHKRYKRLYQFNIMPEQLKSDAIEESEECENLLLANSGMYCVEQEINTFAAVYSAYNKCIQSELFLNKVHSIASQEINIVKGEREKSKEYRSSLLEKDTKELVELLEKEGEAIKEGVTKNYKDTINPYYLQLDYNIRADELKEIELRLKKKYDELCEVDDYAAETKTSAEALFDNVIMGKKNFSLRKFAENYGAWRLKQSRQSNAERAARMQAADELFSDVKIRYQKSNDEIHDKLLIKSIEFLNGKAQEVRQRVLQLVSGSSALDDKRKRELEEIILDYDAIKFQQNNVETLEKGEFEMKLFSLFALDPLNINRFKLSHAYNAEIKRSKEGNYRNIFISHIDKFQAWVQSLVDMLLTNIVDINPTLSAQAEIIKEETQKIEELESRQRKLNQYVEQIHKMMQWREA